MNDGTQIQSTETKETSKNPLKEQLVSSMEEASKFAAELAKRVKEDDVSLDELKQAFGEMHYLVGAIIDRLNEG